MKKFSFLMTMLVAAVLLASCSKKQGARLVPDDAMLVVRLDMAQTIGKCGLDGSNSELKNWLEKQIGQADMTGEAREKILQIVEDPTASGIDFTEPVYFYTSIDLERTSEVGFTATMASEDDLTSLLNAFAKENGSHGPKSGKNGVKSLSLDGTAAIIYNSEWFFAGQVDDMDSMIETLLRRADGKGSLQGNKAFDQMCDKDGVAQFLFLGNGLKAIMGMAPEAQELNNTLPEGTDIKDFAMLWDLALNPGEALVTMDYIALSDAWKKHFEETEKLALPIDRKQARYISDNWMSAFVNIKTDELYKNVEKTAKLYGFESPEVLEAIKTACDALNGQASFHLYGTNDEGPLFTAYVDTKDESPLEMFTELLADDEDDIAITETGAYAIPYSYDWDWDEESEDWVKKPSAWLTMGYRDGQTYITDDEDNVFAQPDEEYPFDVVKGKGFYFRLNFRYFRFVLGQGSNPAAQVYQTIGKMFDMGEIYYEGGNRAILRLTTRDKSKTPLEVIGETLKQFLDEN